MAVSFNATLIPTVSAGNLLTRLVDDSSLNVRWLTALDPVHHSSLNRPLIDVVVRQLILAKTIDNIGLRLSGQSLFPFLVQAVAVDGGSTINLPDAWIWDMNVSAPAKWEYIRLAKIKRVSGNNTTEYTGKLRLVFTGQQEGSATEVALFQADYEIDSLLAYQIFRVEIPTSLEESNPIDASQANTIDGFVTFRTLDVTDTTVQAFFDFLAPPVGGTDSDSDGEYDSPAVYQLLDSPAGGSTEANDFLLSGLTHGTGVLVDNATTSIPSLDSDIATWITTFNYPFDNDATVTSASHPSISIPSNLFVEFNMAAPTSDEPTGTLTGGFYPVWISRILRDDADTLSFYFSTHQVEEPTTTVPIEFARLTLERAYAAGRIVEIEAIENLWPTYAGSTNWHQGFGTGHVVLSAEWGSTSDTVDNFFDSFASIIASPPAATFTKTTTRLSSFALSRVPKYMPTKGQWEALLGSLDGDLAPSSTNRYVTEQDQGLGDAVDFETMTGFTVNADIERYGYTGSLITKKVALIVDGSGTAHDYTTDILPRLVVLFGRDPIFGDEWWDGTKWKRYNGDTWTAV